MTYSSLLLTRTITTLGIFALFLSIGFLIAYWLKVKHSSIDISFLSLFFGISAIIVFLFLMALQGSYIGSYIAEIIRTPFAWYILLASFFAFSFGVTGIIKHNKEEGLKKIGLAITGIISSIPIIIFLLLYGILS